MRKRYAGILLLAAVLGLAGCGGSGGGQAPSASKEAAAEEAEQTEETEDGAEEDVESAEEPLEKPAAVEKEEVESVVELVNPFIEAGTLEKAVKLAGFACTLPETPEGYTESAFRSMPSEMIEVILRGDGDKEIRLRKGLGGEDISGDYNAYPSTETVTIGEAEVTEKSGDDGIHTAIWQNGDYSYAVTSVAGLDAGTVEGLVLGLK